MRITPKSTKARVRKIALPMAGACILELTPPESRLLHDFCRLADPKFGHAVKVYNDNRYKTLFSVQNKYAFHCDKVKHLANFLF